MSYHSKRPRRGISKPAAVATLALILVLIAAALSATYVPSSGGGGGSIATQYCPTSVQQYMTGIKNNSNVDTILCAQVQLSQVGGSTTCPNGQYAIELSNGAFTCSTISFSQLNNVPNLVNNLTEGARTVKGQVMFVNTTSIGVNIAGADVYFKLNTATCTSGKYATGIGNSPELSCAQVLVSQLSGWLYATCPSDEYQTGNASSGPQCSNFVYAGCPAGQFVTGNQTSGFKCGTPASASYTYASCPSNEVVYGNMSTGFLCEQLNTDQISGWVYGTCPGGQFAYGNSSSGFKCASVSISYLYMTCTSGQYVTGNYTGGFHCGQVSVGQVSGWVYMTCTSGQYVYGNSTSGFKCGQVTVGQISGFEYMTCPSNEYVYGNQSSGFKCEQVSVGQVSGFGYMTCPTGQYVYGNQSNGFKCSQVSTSQITGFAYASCPANEYVTGNESSGFYCSQVGTSQLSGWLYASCPANQYVSGNLSSGFSCSQVSVGKISGWTYATCSAGDYVTGNYSSGFHCGQVSVGQISGWTYATCTTNQYVYGNQTSGFKCGQVSVSQITGFAYMTCPSNEYVTGNQSSGFKCSQVGTSQLTGWVYGSCPMDEYVTGNASSGFNCSSVSVTVGNISGWLYTTCPTNQYVTGNYSSGFHCSQVSIGQVSGLTYMTCPTNDYVYGNQTSGFKCAQVSIGQVSGWQYMTCSSNQYVYGNATSGFKCQQVTTSQVSGWVYATCTSGQYATGNQSSGFKCAQVSVSQLSGLNYMTCPSNEYVYGNLSSGFKCAQVSTSQVSGWGYFTCPSNQYVTGNYTSGFYCSQVTTAKISGWTYATCTTGEWVDGNSSSGFSCGNVSWTTLANYPASCPAGQFINTIAATPICESATVGAGAIVQANDCGWVTSVTSRTCALVNPPSTGNVILVMTYVHPPVTGHAKISSVVDTVSSTFNNILQAGVSTGMNLIVDSQYAIFTHSSTADSITVTMNNTVTMDVKVLELTGIDTDALTNGIVSSTVNTGTSTPLQLTSSFTPPAGYFVFAAATWMENGEAARTWTFASPFIEFGNNATFAAEYGGIVSGSAHYSLWVDYPVWPTSTSTTATMTPSGGTTMGTWAMEVVALPTVGAALEWSDIFNFPTGCTSNQYVTGISTTLSCSQVSAAGLTGWIYASCPTNEYVSGNESSPSGFICSQLTVSQIAGWGYMTCPTGEFVNGNASSGFDCGYVTNLPACTYYVYLVSSTIDAKNCATGAIAYTATGSGAATVFNDVLTAGSSVWVAPGTYDTAGTAVVLNNGTSLICSADNAGYDPFYSAAASGCELLRTTGYTNDLPVVQTSSKGASNVLMNGMTISASFGNNEPDLQVLNCNHCNWSNLALIDAAGAAGHDSNGLYNTTLLIQAKVTTHASLVNTLDNSFTNILLNGGNYGIVTTGASSSYVTTDNTFMNIWMENIYNTGWNAVNRTDSNTFNDFFGSIVSGGKCVVLNSGNPTTDVGVNSNYWQGICQMGSSSDQPITVNKDSSPNFFMERITTGASPAVLVQNGALVIDEPWDTGTAFFNWNYLTNFPGGCSAGKFVTAVGATLTCTTPTYELPGYYDASAVTVNPETPYLYQVSSATNCAAALASTATSFTCAFPGASVVNNYIVAVMTCIGATTGACSSGVAATDTSSDTFTASCTELNQEATSGYYMTVIIATAKVGTAATQTITWKTFGASGKDVMMSQYELYTGGTTPTFTCKSGTAGLTSSGTAVSTASLSFTTAAFLIAGATDGTYDAANAITSTGYTVIQTSTSASGAAIYAPSTAAIGGTGPASGTTFPMTLGTSAYWMEEAVGVTDTGINAPVSSGLSLASLTASTNYEFQANLYYSVASGATMQFVIDSGLGSGSTVVGSCILSIGSTNDCVTATQQGYFTALQTGTGSYSIWGTITLGSSGGTLQIDVIDVATSSAAITIEAGSNIVINPVTS